MTRPMNAHSHCHDRTAPRVPQSGAVLIVSLVLLLVMTILGVAAMNGAIMQGLMSSSYQQQTVTLAYAENLLLEGELDVELLVASGAAARNYYFDLAASPDDAFPATKTAAAWPHDFVIEYMGEFAVPGESVNEGGGFADSVVHIFRVSARRARADEERGGLRIVQSLYVTLDGPYE
jgi:type IV pilus assembly protein PilX